MWLSDSVFCRVNCCRISLSRDQRASTWTKGIPTPGRRGAGIADTEPPRQLPYRRVRDRGGEFTAEMTLHRWGAGCLLRCKTHYPGDASLRPAEPRQIPAPPAPSLQTRGGDRGQTRGMPPRHPCAAARWRDGARGLIQISAGQRGGRLSGWWVDAIFGTVPARGASAWRRPDVPRRRAGVNPTLRGVSGTNQSAIMPGKTQFHTHRAAPRPQLGLKPTSPQQPQAVGPFVWVGSKFSACTTPIIYKRRWWVHETQGWHLLIYSFWFRFMMQLHPSEEASFPVET